MAEANPVRNFFNRVGNTFRNLGPATRNYFRSNYTPDGIRQQLAQGDALSDARVIGNTIRRNSNPANFLGSLLTGVGREAWNLAGTQGPGPSYGDMAPTRATVSVGDINTNGSGTPIYINPSTGLTYQNTFPGITGPYQHQPAQQVPVTLPEYSSPRPSSGLPGITSSLSGTGYGPGMPNSGFAGNQGTSWNAASSASGGARLYGGNGGPDNGTGTWDWRTFMIEQ